MKEQGHGHIPDDCWELIFEKVRQDDERDLDSISLVSKRFLSISNRVKLSLKVNDETISFLPDFFRRFRYIETIIIGTDACKNIDGLVDQITPSDLLNLQAIKFGGFPTRHRRAQYVFKSLVALSKNRKNNLKVLDCSGLICMQESDLVLIADLFPRLEELKITAAINNGDVAARGVDALASKLKDLKEFAFTGNTYFITDQSLISLSTNCVKLKRISLVGISSTDQHYVTGEGIDFVMRHSPNLTDLSLHLWSLQSSASSFKIANGYTNAKNLHSLSMNKQLISNKHIRLIAKARPALKTLKLIGYRGRYFEIHGALKLLLQACELTLEELNLGCWPLTDANISNLAEHLSNLTFIDLQGCFELTSVTFYTLTRSCPSLEILKMTNERGQQMDTCRFKKKEMDTFSLDFFPKNYSMRHLDVSGVRWLTDMTLMNFGQVCPNLQFLGASHCLHLTNFGIGEVLLICPAITQLSIDSVKVSDVFGNYFVNLSSVNLKTLRARSTQINDEGMTKIGNRCRNLQYLDIGYCKKVTDKGVMEVVRNCERLRNISLLRCEEVSANILPQMVLSSPPLGTLSHHVLVISVNR